MTSLDAIDQWKPKFTKELAHGLSFGENPPNTYDSFGKYRAKTIARIIDINGLTKTNSSFIISNLKKIGFNIYELYRNPFVKVNEYKYRFDRIEKFLIGTKTIYQPQINFSKVLLPSNKYLMAARKIAYMICNEAIFYGDNFSWVYFKKQKDVYMFVNASDVDKYGIALFLKKVYTLFPFDSIFSEVSESIFLSYGINLNSVLEKFQNSISQPNGEIGVRESYEILRRSHYSNSMLADRIIERFKDFDIAFPNKYAKNWDDASGEEFNPTLTDGLAALGYFFLRLADNNDKVSELESLTYQKTLYKIRKVYN